MQANLTLWTQVAEGGWSAQGVTGDQPAWIGVDGQLLLSPVNLGAERAALIRPVRPVEQSVGVALVSRSGIVACNGVPLQAGVHALRHADSLTVAGKRFFVSVRLAAVEVAYDPAVHPPEVHCFITKVRILPGEPVVICPGTPEKSCGFLNKRDAWNMAMSRPRFKCPNCGFHPQRADWHPPEQRDMAARVRLDALLTLTRLA